MARTLVRVALAGFTVGALVLAGMQVRPDDGETLALGAQPLEDFGACDVSGVDVRYSTQWAPSPTPGEHVVTAATVSQIDPACQGAELTVTLRNVDGAITTDLASATGLVGNATTQTLTFAPTPPAAAVNDVFVSVTGGLTPIPNECKTLKLDAVMVGTTGDDVIFEPKGASLIYGLTGNDTITGRSVDDCIVVGSGTNTVKGATGDDVILAGDGKNAIEGEGGHDLIKVGNGDGNVVLGGNGEDTIHIGTGNNNVIDGGNGKKNTCHLPYPASQLAAHNTVVVNCKVVGP